MDKVVEVMMNFPILEYCVNSKTLRDMASVNTYGRKIVVGEENVYLGKPLRVSDIIPDDEIMGVYDVGNEESLIPLFRMKFR